MKNKILSLIIILLALNFIRVIIVKINNPNYNMFKDANKTTKIVCKKNTSDMYRITYTIKSKRYKIKNVTIKYESNNNSYTDSYNETSNEIEEFKNLKNVILEEKNNYIKLTFNKKTLKSNNNKIVNRIFSYNELLDYLKKENYNCK